MANLVTVPDPQPTPELLGHRTVLESYTSPEFLSFVIETDEDEADAIKLVNDVKKRMAELEEAERFLSADHLAGLEKIRGLFRPAREAAQRARQIWDKRILEARRARKEAAARAMAEAQAAVAQGDVVQAQAAMVRVIPVTRPQGAQIRTRWKIKSVDVTKLEAAYLMPNTAAITQAMNDQLRGGQAPALAGVEFEQVESLAATG